MTDAALAVFILLPLVITYFLKSNAALAFLALCGGYALESLASSDILNGLDKANLKVDTVSLDLLLIVLPPLLTLLLTGRAISGSKKTILYLIAALLVGVCGVMIALPFLSAVMQLSLSTSKVWSLVQHIQSFAITGGVVYSLVLIWFSKNKHPDKKHK
jgi:intracellular septation protein A